MTNSLRLHGLQHARLFCPPLSPGVCSDSCLLSVMLSNHLVLCYPILLCLSSFPASEFSPGGKGELALCTRWPKYWSFSISSSNEYSGLISLRLIGLISLPSKGHSRVFSSTTVQRHRFFGALPSYSPALTTICDH